MSPPTGNRKTKSRASPPTALRSSAPESSPEPTEAGAERIQKVLAAAGLGSRREIEAWIETGRIRLNGRLAKLGDKATREDELSVDGLPISVPAARSTARVLIYHKPTGEIVTRHDTQGRPTVFDAIPPPPDGKWIAVGRLDINTSGLLLLTDSGELANRLMHPSFGVIREYAVRVQGKISRQDRARLLSAVQLADGPGRFATLELAANSPTGGVNRWYRVTIGEGRNREVRRLFEAVGARVSRLVRLRYGSIELPEDLAPGRWRVLDARQVALLTDIPAPGRR